MTDVYARKSYGEQTIGFGRSLAILVVDFQLGFVDPRFQMGGGPMIESAVERTADLLAVARSRGVPVANCYVAYPRPEAAPYWKVTAVPRDLVRGSDACRLDPRIVDHDHDFVFEKYGASAFFQTPLASYLAKSGVDTVAITGCVTSGCVRASVVDSFQLGMRTMLVDDCCADNDPQPHADTLRDVGRRYADIVQSDDVIRHLMGNTG
ncbi:MAG: isochorismatase family protein [Ectothiorhodospiraceae bacterium]|nr:isochorismatase family protein [Planctomycetota bacterium]MCP5151761.1 isochorismatase family protein [Chromatiales bacterium]MCP5154292.1 isochorismatase family protein [Ectothiorhodospiraceae bacterium]